MVIGGLLQDNVRQTISGLPGLRSCPSSAPLFRSRDFQRNETELVIIVTPYLVKPVARTALARPDDGFNPASDSTSTSSAASTASTASTGKPSPDGNYRRQVRLHFRMTCPASTEFARMNRFAPSASAWRRARAEPAPLVRDGACRAPCRLHPRAHGRDRPPRDRRLGAGGLSHHPPDRDRGRHRDARRAGRPQHRQPDHRGQGDHRRICTGLSGKRQQRRSPSSRRRPRPTRPAARALAGEIRGRARRRWRQPASDRVPRLPSPGVRESPRRSGSPTARSARTRPAAVHGRTSSLAISRIATTTTMVAPPSRTSRRWSPTRSTFSIRAA